MTTDDTEGHAGKGSDEPPRELSDAVLEQIAESREQIEQGEYTEIE